MSVTRTTNCESRCLLIVAGVVAVLEEYEVVLDHDLSAEDHGQELVVAHVLVHGRHDVSRLLRSDRQMDRDR
jgi:hypothetical protein